ncbi:glycosyltransferase family 39 protein [Roseibium sp.]|uniref:glycosyltransferase family 39 protein n=1 Tax=Roseibium sp. TaxID=1936156 RepID=UPI003D0C54BF
MRQEPGIPEKYKALSNLILQVILVMAAYLRLSDLGRTSLWYDEAVSWQQSKGSFSELLASVAADNYPPLHNAVLWLTMPLIGDGEIELRLPSALLGVLAVYLIYLAGSTLAGRPAGLLAAAMLAVSPFHIWYSTEARMYALQAACGLAFLLSVQKVLARPSLAWLASLVLSGTLFLYSHYYALFGFAAVGGTCVVLAGIDLAKGNRLTRSPAFTACAAMGTSTLAFLPWLAVLANRAKSVSDEGFWIAYPDAKFLENMAASITGSLTLFWILVALSVAAIAGTAIFSGPGSKSGPVSRRLILVCLAYTVGPLLFGYLYSVLVQPILFDRYLIAAWPGLLLLAAVAAQRLLPALAPIALVAMSLYLTYPELRFTLYEKMRPDWRSIVASYLDRRTGEDRLVLYKGFAAPVLKYYLRDPDAGNLAANPADLARLAKSRRWLLLVHTDRDEMFEALKAFQVSEVNLVSRRFGWGASELSLFKRDSAN